MKNNLMHLKYEKSLRKILENSADQIFTSSEINVNGILLKKLSEFGIITRVGKKKINRQYVNTYVVSTHQRKAIIKALGDLNNG